MASLLQSTFTARQNVSFKANVAQSQQLRASVSRRLGRHIYRDMAHPSLSPQCTPSARSAFGSQGSQWNPHVLSADNQDADASDCADARGGEPCCCECRGPPQHHCPLSEHTLSLLTDGCAS
jgi:hypothetical protein